MTRPGCLVRGALVTFGVLFLPLALWFAWRRFWGQAVALLLVSAAFLKLGLSRDEDSWLAAIDELGERTQK
ncbi:MAG: hypothetical protein JWM41_3684 [Gemmatimonadetes bacterium]|nr:hypothetical protein [Gemmatimonadota bacterium]